MDQLIPLSSEDDDQLRSALHWKLRLQQHGEDAGTLRGFAAWLQESAANQRAFARCESLWQTVQLALSRMPSPSPAPRADKLANENE